MGVNFLDSGFFRLSRKPYLNFSFSCLRSSNWEAAVCLARLLFILRIIGIIGIIE